jgi:hypothetical protein
VGDETQAAVAVTVDVHRSDRGSDLCAASEMLARAGIRATFFITASLFASREHAGALRALPGLQHEVASHGFVHDWDEVDALVSATHPRQLRFLEDARSAAADFYGFAPTTFRSPVWCPLGAPALDELVRLGYTVDSSATPQRLMMLSSRPFGRGWMFASRAPHYIRPTLLEIPTSTLLVPLASPAFRLFRRRVSALLLSLAICERALFKRRLLTVQFDAADFTGASPERDAWTFRNLLPKRHGGLSLRSYFQESSPARIRDTTRALLRQLGFAPACTLAELRSGWPQPTARTPPAFARAARGCLRSRGAASRGGRRRR